MTTVSTLIFWNVNSAIRVAQSFARAWLTFETYKNETVTVYIPQSLLRLLTMSSFMLDSYLDYFTPKKSYTGSDERKV